MNSIIIFNKLKNLLQPYAAGKVVKSTDESTYYLEYAGAKPEMFAAVMIKKNYVSLYYMPVYHQPELLADISPALKKRMQGKSCFNFTNKDDPAIEDLAALIKRTAESI